MRITYINNDGAGWASDVEVPDGVTVSAFFAERMPGRMPADFHIRLNRLPVTADHVLQPGDRLSATPVKIEGACYAH